MDAIDVLRKRRSVRIFQDKPVAKADLEAIVDVARFAPTARNVQPWEFVVITNSKVLTEISKLAENGRFISGSKACIAVFCADTKYYLEDGCAATVNILNAAAALSIGSCWVAGDKKDYCHEVARLLGAPLDHKLVSLIALGYPQDKNSFKLVEKRPLGELIHWEIF
jgi:nitroreductase